jgi:hypothetical protein
MSALTSPGPATSLERGRLHVPTAVPKG